MRRVLLYGGLGVVGVLLLVAVLFMRMLLGRGVEDTPDSALEEREAREDAAGATRENSEPNTEPNPEPTTEPEPAPGELEFSGTQTKASRPKASTLPGALLRPAGYIERTITRIAIFLPHAG